MTIVAFLGCGVAANVMAQESTPAVPAADSAQVDSSAAAPAPAVIEEAETVVEEEVSMHKALKTKFIEGDAMWMAPVAFCLIFGLAICIERIIYLLKEGETVSRPDITLSSGGFFNPFDEEFSFSKAVEGFDNSFRTNIIDGSPLDIPDTGGQTMPVSEESFIEFDSETPATESVSSAANSDSNVRTGYAEESFSTHADMFNAASERRAYSATPAARSFTTDEAVREETTPTEQYIEIDEPELKASGCFPLPGGYVAAAVSGRLLMVNVRRARQRLFFDRMWTICSSEHAMPRQKLMFESVTELTPADMRLARECEADLRELGFDFEFSDENNVTITAVPSDDTSSDAGALFEEVLQGVKTAEEGVYVSDKKERFIASLARAAARSGSSTVNGKEAEALIDELLKCKNFTYTPDGTRIYVAMSRTDIDNLF